MKEGASCSHTGTALSVSGICCSGGDLLAERSLLSSVDGQWKLPSCCRQMMVPRLNSEVMKLQKVLIVLHVGEILAKFLPIKNGVCFLL